MARITGINSGLDIDALVKASMTTYQSKIDKEAQNKKVLEYQQEQYKKIISDAANFYDKYFDILKTGNLMSTSSYQSVSFKSGDDTKVTAKGFAGADVSDYGVTVTQIASKASHTIEADNLKAVKEDKKGVIAVKMLVDNKEKDVYVDVVFDKKYEIDMEATAKKLNTALKDEGINVTAKYSEFSKGIVLESGKMGEKVNFKLAIQDKISEEEISSDKSHFNAPYSSHSGTDAKGVITKGKETYPIDGNSNVITVDNVQFTLKGVTDTEVSLSGSTDVIALKDKIISFVNDYNTLLSSINTKIYETRDKDYMPLSDEQKKEMTDDQIEKWETKAQTGLIRKDMELERITSAMKSAMSTVISGSGLTLESIGIKPVANYAEKNGMFTVDEATLTQALEENASNIKDLFTRAVSTDDKKGGIFTQLAATLKSEFKSSTSSLSKKAGIDGTSTQYSNTLTISIAKKKTLIQELNDKFSVKETALYKKYSALETALGKLTSQQSSLASMLGTN